MSSAWLPAATGLLGTGLGLVVAELRTRRDNRRQDAAFYRDRRRAAYEELWRITEQAHVTARIEDRVHPEQQIELLGSVNSFAMLNAVYIHAADRELAHEYLRACWRFCRFFPRSSKGRATAGLK